MVFHTWLAVVFVCAPPLQGYALSTVETVEKNACSSNLSIGAVETPLHKFNKSMKYSYIKVVDYTRRSFSSSWNESTQRRLPIALLPGPNKNVCGNLQPIFESRKFRISRNKRRYITKHCSFPLETIHEIAAKTVNQFKDYSYNILRKYRLTASSFGIILAAIRRNSYPPSLFKKLVGAYNLERVAALQWGKFHESSALASLRRKYPQLKIRPAGLYLHTSGVLGASPDAITDDCVIEIKCPYRFRYERMLFERLINEPNYILTRTEDGTYDIDKQHYYYSQIQAQILFSGRKYGLLYIWTPNDSEVFKIDKDEAWTANIDLILDFYFSQYIPYVLNLKRQNITQLEKKLNAKVSI